MIWRIRRHKARAAPPSTTFHISYRLQTGTGHREAHSADQLSAMIIELRAAGAGDITVTDGDGNLVSFLPASQ